MNWLRFDWTAIIAERKIKEAIDDGVFDNVPGKGEPLDLDEYIMQTPEQRITTRILKNANALPEWLQLEKDIEREIHELNPRKERMLRAVHAARTEANRERLSERLRKTHKERLDMLNNMILKYNFVTPPAVQRVFSPYVVRREMAALEEAITQTAPMSASKSQ